MDAITLIWILNLAVNGWNIYAIGNSWIEARISGGFRRLTMWLGATLVAVSLSWNLLSFESYFAYAFNYLDLSTIQFIFFLGYPFLFAGLIFSITFASWSRHYQREINGQYTPTIHNASFYPVFPSGSEHTHATERNGFQLSLGDDDFKFIVLAVIVSIALLGGVLITYFGIRYFAERSEANEAFQAPA
jgi:hypothetical protein